MIKDGIVLEMHEEILERGRGEEGGGSFRQTRSSIEDAGAGVAEV